MNIYESFLQSRSRALTTGHDSSICFLANSSNCFLLLLLLLFFLKLREKKEISFPVGSYQSVCGFSVDFFLFF